MARTPRRYRLGVLILSATVIAGCSPPPPPPPAPQVKLSDEEFIRRLAAEQDAKDAQDKAAGTSATSTSALQVAEYKQQQAEAWLQASYLSRAIHMVTREPLPYTPPRVTTAIFEPVFRATKAVQAATWARVDFIKYSELLQALATELSIAKDLGPQMNSSDKRLLLAYEDVFETYQSSKALWQKKLDGQGDTMPSVQALWEKIDKKIEMATAMYYSQPAIPAIASS